jgi:hypothetical protein
VPCHLLLQVTLLLLLLLPVCRQMVASQHLLHRLQQRSLPPMLLPPCLPSLLLLLPWLPLLLLLPPLWRPLLLPSLQQLLLLPVWLLPWLLSSPPAC